MPNWPLYLCMLFSVAACSSNSNSNSRILPVYPEDLHVKVSKEYVHFVVPWDKYFIEIHYTGDNSSPKLLSFWTRAESVGDGLLFVQWPPMLLRIRPEWKITSATLKHIPMYLMECECKSDVILAHDLYVSICPYSLRLIISRFHECNPKLNSAHFCLT